MCLSLLSMEDVEDINITGIMVTGFLMFGVGGSGCIATFQQVSAGIGKQDQYEGMCLCVISETRTLNKMNRRLAANLYVF